MADRIDPSVPTVGVELGVLTGKLSVPLLERFPLLTLYMVDLWAPPAPGSSYAGTPDDHARKSALDHERDRETFLSRVRDYGDRVRVLRMDTVAAAGVVPAVDWVFLDADHSRVGVEREVDAWFPKVRQWIGGHDYGHPLFPGVAEAVDAAFGGRVVLDTDRTWFVEVE